MSASEVQNLASIASAILSPFIGAAVAVWTYRSQIKERMAVQIVWGHKPDHNGQPEECPFVYVQNQSDREIAVVEITYLRGSLLRTRTKGTALYYEDPFFDISFPYEIEPGKTHRFQLSEYSAKAITDTASLGQQLLQRAGRSAVWLEVRTMGNARVRIPAWDATPWKNRADWLR